MDLVLDSVAFAQASRDLDGECEKLKNLKRNMEASFEQLKKDWDSDAGKAFFDKFEKDLVQNLERYVTVFEYMSKNLATASQKYEEVFRAADAVINVQY